MATKIGFIGQGWIGRHYADDFELRGYDTVRYSLEKEYRQNKNAIGTCDLVFIAVPTPTTPNGFDDSIVREALALIGTNKIAVVKSTVAPGTTEKLQEDFPNCVLLHSPEFLREASAAFDAAHPDRNIIGIAQDTKRHREAAEFLLRVLPPAPYNVILSAKEAELVKYAGNCFLYTKVVFMNLLFDLVAQLDCSWEGVRDALSHDPRIGTSHMQPVHKSNNESLPGRGAGGHCFIKDFETFRGLYQKMDNKDADKLLEILAAINNTYLINSKKDLDLLEGVYGAPYIEQMRREHNTA